MASSTIPSTNNTCSSPANSTLIPKLCKRKNPKNTYPGKKQLSDTLKLSNSLFPSGFIYLHLSEHSLTMVFFVIYLIAHIFNTTNENHSYGRKMKLQKTWLGQFYLTIPRKLIDSPSRDSSAGSSSDIEIRIPDELINSEDRDSSPHIKIYIPQKIVKTKGWKKGQDLKTRFNERGNLVLEDV